MSSLDRNSAPESYKTGNNYDSQEQLQRYYNITYNSRRKSLNVQSETFFTVARRITAKNGPKIMMLMIRWQCIHTGAVCLGIANIPTQRIWFLSRYERNSL